MAKFLESYWSPPAFWQRLSRGKRVTLVLSVIALSVLPAAFTPRNDLGTAHTVVTLVSGNRFWLQFVLLCAINTAVMLLGVTALGFRGAPDPDAKYPKDVAHPVAAALFTRSVFGAGLLLLTFPTAATALRFWTIHQVNTPDYYNGARYMLSAFTSTVFLLARAIPLVAGGIVFAAVCRRPRTAICTAIAAMILIHRTVWTGPGVIDAVYPLIPHFLRMGLDACTAALWSLAPPILGLPSMYGCGCGGYYNPLLFFDPWRVVLSVVTVPQICYYLAVHFRRRAALREHVSS